MIKLHRVYTIYCY